jgi:hypothetical protein
VELPHEHSELRKQAQAIIEELAELEFRSSSWNFDPLTSERALEIFSSDRALLVEVLFECLEELDFNRKRVSKMALTSLENLAIELLRRNLELDSEQIATLISLAHKAPSFRRTRSARIVDVVDKFVKKHGLTEPIRSNLEKFARMIAVNIDEKGTNRIANKALSICNGSDPKENPVKLESGEAAGDQIIADCKLMATDESQLWNRVLNHAVSLTAVKPSTKWQTEAQKLLEQVGRENFSKHASRWLSLIGVRGTRAVPSVPPDHWTDPNELICATNAEVLKGIVWFLVSYSDDETARLLGTTADACFKKLKNHGARSPKIANACVGALSMMPFKEAISQLSRLAAKAKSPSARKTVDKGLGCAAERSGMTVEDLQELSVSDFGFSKLGVYRKQFAQFEVEIVIAGVHSLVVNWSVDGKPLKAPSAAMKRDFPLELKAIKKTVIELEKLLPSIRDRIEMSLLQQRNWSFSVWRERYLEHPVCGVLARRLLWTFNGITGFYLDGKICDLVGAEIEAEDHTLVELWHPIASSAGDVLAWRTKLQELAITQPFKQVYREIYLLTDAERKTAKYSNRFAAHLLRQHQFAELCKQRGWHYALQGQWDSFNSPILKLPKWNLEVEFFVVPAIDDAASDSGVYLHLATDQVRFRRLDSLESIELSEIMPIVFTEVMRDVDLFVGGCSVGNDPNWQDGGTLGTYWQSYSFGELSSSAQTRRAVLQSIVPRLKIASRCSFADKFIVVRGDLRTYKIHLGSGNILMEPNQQYLCIVPARAGAKSDTSSLYLPFEGDSILSVILSKCLLLAEDSKIKDPSILSQIERK